MKLLRLLGRFGVEQMAPATLTEMLRDAYALPAGAFTAQALSERLGEDPVLCMLAWPLLDSAYMETAVLKPAERITSSGLTSTALTGVAHFLDTFAQYYLHPRVRESCLHVKVLAELKGVIRAALPLERFPDSPAALDLAKLRHTLECGDGSQKVWRETAADLRARAAYWLESSATTHAPSAPAPQPAGGHLRRAEASEERSSRERECYAEPATLHRAGTQGQRRSDDELAAALRRSGEHYGTCYACGNKGHGYRSCPQYHGAERSRAMRSRLAGNDRR